MGVFAHGNLRKNPRFSNVCIKIGVNTEKKLNVFFWFVSWRVHLHIPGVAIPTLLKTTAVIPWRAALTDSPISVPFSSLTVTPFLSSLNYSSKKI